MSSSTDVSPAGLIRGRDALREALPALLRRARRELVLSAPVLDAYYFNTDPFVSALTTFAVADRHNQARLLTEDPQQAARDNERLLEVLRRTGDRVELRQLSPDDRGRVDLFLLIDRKEFLVQPDVNRIDAAIASTRAEALAFAQTFETLWARALPVALRPLGL